jgi:hypothetical protein
MTDISAIQKKYQERVGTEAITRENEQLWSDLGVALRHIESSGSRANQKAKRDRPVAE